MEKEDNEIVNFVCRFNKTWLTYYNTHTQLKSIAI